MKRVCDCVLEVNPTYLHTRCATVQLTLISDADVVLIVWTTHL